MRIRQVSCVLFVLPLLGAATPLHAALGVAPRCLPSVAPPAIKTADAGPVLPEPGQVVPVLVPIPSFDAEERDYLIRTIVFEASGETEEGKVAVAHVILNRKRSGRWGDNIKDVVTRPWQFEPWMTKRGQIEKLSQEDPRYRDAAFIADAVLAGEMPDPTAGATHFLNPVIVKQRRGGSLPAWARGKGQPIGRHTFYAPREAGALTERVALAFDDARDPLSC